LRICLVCSAVVLQLRKSLWLDLLSLTTFVRWALPF
jgi:hypothetical protein